MAEGKPATPANIEAVARAATPEDAAWAFTQWELRQRARTKFPNAVRMLFTREALEQASPLSVARYHASRFPRGGLVADLTAGIGGDLLALAERGPVIAFEVDEERAAYAEWNTGVPVRREDALAVSWEWEYAFCDPSRRRGGARLRSPEQYSPDPAEVAQRMGALRLGGIKLSPMLSDSFLESLGHRLEFISFHDECIEALIWIGRDAEPGRYAVQVSDERPATFLPASGALPQRRAASAFVFDADPAAVRAHALGTLAASYALNLLADSVGYLTGDAPVASPWLRGYRVLADAPARERLVREAVRGLRGTVAEVKSRVRDTAQFGWLSRFREGPRPVTAMLYPSARSVRVLLVEPLQAER